MVCSKAGFLVDFIILFIHIEKISFFQTLLHLVDITEMPQKKLY